MESPEQQAHDWAERVMIAVRQRYPNYREALPSIMALMESARVGDDPEDLERELWAVLRFTLDDGTRLPESTFMQMVKAVGPPPVDF